MTDLHTRLAENQRIIEGLRHDDSDMWKNYSERACEEFPQLNTSLRKVLELHKPTDLVGGVGCNRCLVYVDAVDDEVHEAWPCPTVKAIEEAMSGAGN